MKKIIIMAGLLIASNIVIFSQKPDNIKLIPLDSADTDSSLLDYFPLTEGNLWQYRYRDSPGQMGWIENMISLSDTVMPDGLTYTKLFNPPYEGTGSIKYCRFDSQYNVVEYIDSLCNEFYDPDTLGLWDPPVFHGCISDTSVSVFKLNVPDSSYWLTYFNIGGNLFWPSLRYMGKYETEIFGMNTYAKVFTQYFRQYYPRDSIWEEYYGWSYILIKGIGIYSTGYGESSTATLQGAIINGVKFGTVVGMDEEKFGPASFTLYQNYPNPFNPNTTIEYNLERGSNVTLIIYNLLGEEVVKLVEEYQTAGNYKINFNARDLSSSVYIYSIKAGDFFSSKKMILTK